MPTQRAYDEANLRRLERELASITAPGRQVPETEVGRAYRRALKEEIADVWVRLQKKENELVGVGA
jgi:hypothetical protein